MILRKSLISLKLLFIIILPSWRNNPLLVIIIFLLPLATILHAFIFLAKTSFPLRPPYAIYLMPLALIGGTHVLCELWQRVSVYYSKVIFIYFLVPITFGTLLYVDKQFYSTTKKTDWRGLTQYLELSTNKRHLLLSDTFVTQDNLSKRSWEPNFYGFARYYKGHAASAITLSQLPIIKEEFLYTTLEPILIFFEWHSYFLTPLSPYPIMRAGGSQPDFSILANNPLINLKRFTGFSVLQLNDTAKQGNLGKDTLMLLRVIQPLLPDNSSSIDIIRAIYLLENKM